MSCFCCGFGGAGWGTRASNPFGVSGVITMKIISKTKRMSIKGTTFIEAIEPFFEPTSIPMFVLPLVLLRFGSASAGRPYRRRWRSTALFGPFRQQADVIHAGRTHLID